MDSINSKLSVRTFKDMSTTNDNEALARFYRFRDLCFANAEAALKAAKVLQNKHVNHIAYHTLVLALEEIGKIFVGFNEFMKPLKRKEETLNWGFDDHIKKLFWAVWGPSIGRETITKVQWNENQRLATQLHESRLASLYTALDDTHSGTEKISDDSLNALIRFVQSRLNLARVEDMGEYMAAPNDDMAWLDEAMEDPATRAFIFGTVAQAHLLTLGNPRQWVAWLKETEEQRRASLTDLMDKELARRPSRSLETFTPKWMIKIKLHSPSHTVRQKILDEANKQYQDIQFFKGGDVHTLLVEFTLGEQTAAQALWHDGWLISKLFVTALNICTNGIFYWNIPADTSTYYESIRDLQNNINVDAQLAAGLTLGWGKRKSLLNFQHLMLTKLTFEYLLSIRPARLREAVSRYAEALALMAKSDLHARFEPEVFAQFFISLRVAIQETDKLAPDVNITERVQYHLQRMIRDQDNLAFILALGYEQEHGQGHTNSPITLAEVILMKQFSGMFLMTLAVRLFRQDDSLLLTVEENEV